MASALLVVDVQNDFLPGGSLAVAQGFDILPRIKTLLHEDFALIIASRDFHPAGHISFASAYKDKQPFKDTREEDGKSFILWPDHCVQGTPGCELHSDLSRWLADPRIISKVNIVDKGTAIGKEAFSAFDATTCLVDMASTDNATSLLTQFLRNGNIKRVFCCGLATDYCVRATALDARKDGFETFLIRDAVRGIGPDPWQKFEEQGIKILHSAQVGDMLKRK